MGSDLELKKMSFSDSSILKEKGSERIAKASVDGKQRAL